MSTRSLLWGPIRRRASHGLTSGGSIMFQRNGDGTIKKDGTYLYLVAGAAGITGVVFVW